MNALDTNILVYALDEDEPTRRTKARELIIELLKEPTQTVFLWQVATELLACLRKWQSAGRLARSDVEAHFRDLLALFPLRTPSVKAFDIAFSLHSRFSLSHWDSMLLAACKDAGVSLLYSEDFDAGTDYDGLRIVNPFA